MLLDESHMGYGNVRTAINEAMGYFLEVKICAEAQLSAVSSKRRLRK